MTHLYSILPYSISFRSRWKYSVGFNPTFILIVFNGRVSDEGILNDFILFLVKTKIRASAASEEWSSCGLAPTLVSMTTPSKKNVVSRNRFILGKIFHLALFKAHAI